MCSSRRPREIVLDNGPKLTSKAIDQWVLEVVRRNLGQYVNLCHNHHTVGLATV